MNQFYIILIIAGAIVLWLIATFNTLIRKRNRVKEAYSDIEVQLKRRHDLIPNIVNTVKGYAGHEEGVFTKVTEARANAISAHTPVEHDKAENMLSGALKSLFAVAEAYPELKANTNFLELQRELSDTENKIQASRRFYNSAAMDLKTAIESFPTNIIASAFTFKPEEFFDMDEAEKVTPEVKF